MKLVEKVVRSFVDLKFELSSLEPTLKDFWDEFESSVGWEKFKTSSRLRQSELAETFVNQTLATPSEIFFLGPDVL